MNSTEDRIGRLAILLVAAVLAAALAWALFLELPRSQLARLLGVVLVLLTVLAALRFASSLARSQFPDYNVAEVAVEGPITRDSGGRNPLPTGPVGATADELVDQVEQAEEDPAVDGLVVRLNTPGGEVLPSEDIRDAVAAFDGPTVAYATDTCASGGYWIASGADEIWAREPSVIGSIGVIGSRPNAADLAERLGISYEQFTAGEYKDAGTPLKEIEEHEREYLQGIVDDLYDRFVETVAEGRDLTESQVRDTEAKVYLGEEAEAIGLVDELGDMAAVEDRLAERLHVEEVQVAQFEPERSLSAKLGMGARSVAYSLGAGIASQVTDEDGLGLDFRL